ncbi:hypothetical protein DFR86_02415 [Acidianus sulfidivorans JP7]|uniref:DedA family protein n=1 Tax=Acidianus sulfidivorans JP7 TaxID=619593 RepID=A0A2U9IKH4_9CREN|nr:hypothetical protein [Acidianus sulfidivorans]AWR96513.1 hypothetical protein DFR86_02415 [Acidianus sulfidivorans JP7]
MTIYLLLFIFAISFATNATPFFGAPYTIIASTILLKCGVNAVNFFEVVIFTALGAATSKSVMYVLGIGSRRGLKHNKNIIFFRRFINTKYFYITLFIFSIIPFLPLDDLVYILGGVEKAPLISMLEISYVGKIIKSLIEIPIEIFGILQISEAIGIKPVETGIISTIILVILAVALFKLDWEELYNRIEKYIKVHYHLKK